MRKAKMKLVVVVLVCFFAACNAVDKEFIDKLIEEIRSYGEVCISETSASEDDVKTLLERKIPDSHEGKCLVFCMHKKFNMQNEDGSVNKDGILQALETLKANDEETYNKVLTIFNTCSENTEKDDDPCVYAVNLAKCGVEEGRKVGITDDMFVIN